LTPPLFAADVMLGRLARWLRLLGFDTFYDNHAGDDFLAGLVRREGRILLTRDHPLHWSLPAGASYLVEADRHPAQLAEVARALALDRFDLPPRCSRCNGSLVETSLARVEYLVPPFVRATQRRFCQCTACGKVYWAGSHAPRIADRLHLWAGKRGPFPSSGNDG